VAPRTVAVKVRARSTPGPGRGMVEVASVRSMISNGTELKFWRGDFGGDDEDDDEGLDATIEVIRKSGRRLRCACFFFAVSTTTRMLFLF